MILGFGLGIQEMIMCGIVAVLLFGKRLPEVARTLGHSYEQFRKSLREIQSEVDSAIRSTDDYSSRSQAVTYPDDYDDEMPSTPRFEPPQLTGPKTDVTAESTVESEVAPEGEASEKG